MFRKQNCACTKRVTQDLEKTEESRPRLGLSVDHFALVFRNGGSGEFHPKEDCCIGDDFCNQMFVGKGILFEEGIEKKGTWKKNMSLECA